MSGVYGSAKLQRQNPQLYWEFGSNKKKKNFWFKFEAEIAMIRTFLNSTHSFHFSSNCFPFFWWLSGREENYTHSSPCAV